MSLNLINFVQPTSTPTTGSPTGKPTPAPTLEPTSPIPTAPSQSVEAVGDTVNFAFPQNKALDLQPSESLGFIDASGFDPAPTFSVPTTYNVYYYNVDQTGYYDEVVSPNYYNDADCSIPVSGNSYIIPKYLS